MWEKGWWPKALWEVPGSCGCHEKSRREGRACTIEEGELRNEAYWKMAEERVGGLADLTGL